MTQFIRCEDKNGRVVQPGDKLKTFRGEEVMFEGYSTVRKIIYCVDSKGHRNEWYPGFCNLVLVDNTGEKWS